ncbi:glycosyltransferase family 1 protein [Microbacterium sp. NEAU-LLC]|uniref:Glycosyltransferase family 1 protein n=1 Tax=Microbacterium helvum TaxID=2773713 RepID=A0ABR8NJA8_9MICO|nr:glycosyltransferase [Microbacterium helvum]MBD3940517.1 glycosyltransferase family 1 protein [Microbacterium helvum]
MRMLLVTAGSRGDVEPFVALARRATGSGHIVRLAAPDRSGVAAAGVDLTSLGVDYSAMIQAHGVSLGAAMRNYRNVARPAMRAVIVNAARAALDFRPDVIVWHPKVLSAPLIAESLGIPHVLVELVPAMTPTRAFPAAGTVTRSLGLLNRLTYSAAPAARAMFRRDLDEAAVLLGPTVARPAPPAATLLPISPAILPRPDDWAESVVLTGPWRDTRRTVAPDIAGDAAPTEREVDEFTSGGPFIYAGFGSMVAGDPTERGRALLSAARARGLRLLVATGLGGITVPEDARGDDVLAVPTVDHETVLPHAVAAIHHGGIGTVHAATAAGTVSIIVPFIADQPFWGSLLHRRGLAPAPIPRRRLVPERVVAALEQAPGFEPAVASVAAQMAHEDGTATAVKVIEQLR